MKCATSVTRMLSIAIAVCSLTTVCDAENGQASANAAQDLLTCMRTLARDPQYAEISAKLPLQDMNTITFSMLADQSRPTLKERKEITGWFDERDQCWKTQEAALQSQWPPELFQLSNEGSAGIKSIGVELYNGKITFGEANKQIEQLGNTIKARMIPIIKQYQAEIAAQKADAESKREAAAQVAAREQTQYEAQIRSDAAQDQAVRLQRAQVFMNYIQAQQQQLRNQVTPRPTYNTNCFTAGSNTNCTTH
jgi:hypothetical protein